MKINLNVSYKQQMFLFHFPLDALLVITEQNVLPTPLFVDQNVPVLVLI